MRGYRGRINVNKIMLGKEYAKNMEMLHDLRNRADHSNIILSKEDAEYAIKTAESLINAIKLKLEKIVPEVLT